MQAIPNTFGLNVKAKEYIEYASVEELREILKAHKGERWLHIGAGSNLLFTKDFDGIVLHSKICYAKALEEDKESVLIEAGAGIVLDDLIAQVADMDLYGLENLSHIPGEVGASAIQNVGAYGVEAKDVIEKVKTIEVDSLCERVFSKEECGYGYRDSVFKNEGKGKYIVTSVVYRLRKNKELRLDYGHLREALAGKEPTAMAVREAVIAIRKAKLPEVGEIGSAGSFFKNPVVSKEVFEAILQKESKDAEQVPHFVQEDGIKIPAAWLIEQCGWKGKSRGGAKVYEKQPLVIVNTGEAKGEEIVALSREIIASVKERFGIVLHEEVNIIE